MQSRIDDHEMLNYNAGALVDTWVQLSLLYSTFWMMGTIGILKTLSQTTVNNREDLFFHQMFGPNNCIPLPENQMSKTHL